MTSDVLKQIWPEWEIDEKPLGKGSYGVVYKAARRDHNVESYAAIKVISIPSDPSEMDSLRSEGLDIEASKTFLHSIVDAFVNEIQLMESLKGIQNIVSVEDYKVVEKTDGIGWNIYIRMELLTPFNTFFCGKKLTEEEVIKLGCDICTALEICGKRSIIHRDIKPENIFRNDFGDFKLGDFGIARKLENMTGGLSKKGSPNYMAPEVAAGSDYDSRVDIYSLGIVLYRQLNNNRLPFLDTKKQLLNHNERENALNRRLRGETIPAPCDASAAMADVILRACAYDPNMRFSSATEMKQALMSVANHTCRATGAGNSGKTTSARRAPDNSDQQAGPVVNTFGPVSDGDARKRKKIKMIITISSVISAACVALVLAIILLPKITNNSKPDVAVGNVSSSSKGTTSISSSKSSSSSASTTTSSSSKSSSSSATSSVTPISSPTKIDVTFNANGGTVSTNKITVTSGNSYGTLPTPTQDYYTFEGWYTSANGGNRVSGTTEVSGSSPITLYAHWKQNSESDWTLSSNVPSGAKITNQKWTYTQTKTKESKSSNESGWTQTGSRWETINEGSYTYIDFPANSNGREYYSTSDYYYTHFANKPLQNSETENTKRSVKDQSVSTYIYYHWCYPLAGNHSEGDRPIGSYNGQNTQYGNTTVWESFEGGNISYNNYANAYQAGGHSTYSYWWNGKLPVHKQTYTDYEKVYQYKMQTSLESTTEIKAGGEISNVQKYVKYISK